MHQRAVSAAARRARGDGSLSPVPGAARAGPAALRGLRGPPAGPAPLPRRLQGAPEPGPARPRRDPGAECQRSFGRWRVETPRDNCASARSASRPPLLPLLLGRTALPRKPRVTTRQTGDPDSVIQNQESAWTLQKEELTTNPSYQCKWNEIPQLRLQD